MGGVSDSVENELLDHILSTAAWTMPSGAYVSLHTADPGETGVNEVVGGSYGRQGDTAFDVAASGATSNTADITFTSMPACTVTHVGIWEVASAGTFIAGGIMAPNKPVGAGGTLIIPAGDLDVTLD